MIKETLVVTNTDEPVTPDSKPKRKFVLSRDKGKRKSFKQMTPAQKAEAVALWRSGEFTLDALAKKFSRRPETLSRLFSEMGIKKGEAAAEHQAKIEKEMQTRLLNDAAEQANRIAKVKEDHFKMADALGKLVWQEIVAAKKAGKSIEKLRGTMHTLQMASATLSNVRGELYRILQIDKFEEKKEDEDLPELTVRELTEDETKQLQAQSSESEDDLDVGEIDELPSETDSGEG